MNKGQRVLFFCLALYICNIWLDLVPSHQLSAYSAFGGVLYLFAVGDGWTGVLSFLFCFGFFLSLRNILWCIGRTQHILYVILHWKEALL